MSRKIEQVNSYFQEELNSIIVQNLELPKDSLVTITKVLTSKDLGKAIVYLSIFPINQKSSILTKIQKASNHLRYLLSKRFKGYKVPILEFVFDDSLLKQRMIEREIEDFQS